MNVGGRDVGLFACPILSDLLPFLYGNCRKDFANFPLRGWPKGKVRLRFYSEEFARGYVRSKNKTRCFYLCVKNGAIHPGYEIESKYTRSMK